MPLIANQAAPDTIAAYRVAGRIYKVLIEIEERDGENTVSDLWAALRLAWMEAGRDLETKCARDGISRWTYRWPHA